MPRPQDLRPGHIVGLTRRGVTLRWRVVSACPDCVVAVHADTLAILPIRDGRLMDPAGGVVELAWVRQPDAAVWSRFSVSAVVGVA